MNDNFKRKLIKKLYKKDIDTIIKLNNLQWSLCDSDDLIVFKKLNLEKIKNEESLVVGGACIDRCEGEVKNLGISFYLDILMPVNFSLEQSLPVAIYVDTPVETLFSTRDESKKWLEFVKKVELFLNNLSDIIGKEIKVTRRDKGVKILDKMLTQIRFDDEKLKGLYDLVPSQKNNFTKDLLLHFRRSICSYLPEYLSSYFDENIENIVAVEELSQVKAITKAQNINSNVFFESYLDMPSTTCKNRMHRSPNGKIPIFEDIKSFNKDELFETYIKEISLDKIFEIFGTNDFYKLVKSLNKLWG